jgi:uncharacterized membrane protein
MAITKEKVREAIQAYDNDKVMEVRQLVAISDPDGVWSLYRDMEDEEGAEIVELLYFEE